MGRVYIGQLAHHGGLFVGTIMGHTYDKARAGEHIRVKLPPSCMRVG